MQNVNISNGQKLKGFRQQNGYSQEYLGSLVGRGQRIISKYELGQCPIPSTLVDFLNGQYNLKLRKVKKGKVQTTASKVKYISTKVVLENLDELEKELNVLVRQIQDIKASL